MSDTKRTTTFVVDVYPIEDEDAFVERVLDRERQEPWSHLDPDQQQAMVIIMRDALTRMLEDPTEWLPHGLVPHSNDRLALTVLVKFDDIDEMVVSLRVEAERQVAARRDELIAIRGRLQRGAHDQGS